MNDLLKKLNVLMRSTLHDALGDESRRSPVDSGKMGKNLDRDVEQLRQRINDALSFEDQLQARVQSLKAEVEDWDRQADEAVASANDAHARYAIEQMQRAQQRLAIAESDLREHQLVTQELIMRVNTLDAAVADAHQAENQPAAPPEQTDTVPTDSNVSEAAQDVAEKAADKVNAPSAESQTVEDDLAQRLRRLSKPE